MFQPDMQIEHSWYLRYKQYPGSPHMTVTSYSNSFVGKLLPDVEFKIFCSISNKSDCKIILSKTPCRPANATVRIVIKYIKMEGIHDYPWIDDCTLHCDFPIPDTRCEKCKDNSPHFIYYKFTCYITWRGFKGSKRPVDCDLYGHLKHFLTVPDFSDMTIVIDEEEIPVHKLILAAYSPVFFKMFKADMTESVNKRIVVTDIEVDTMKKVIEFLYTGVINPVLEFDDLLSILKVADKYEIMDLKELCEQKCYEKITMKNVFEILEKTSLYGGSQLMEKVVSFMVENKLSIIKLENLAELHREKPELLSNFFIRSIADDSISADQKVMK